MFLDVHLSGAGVPFQSSNLWSVSSLWGVLNMHAGCLVTSDDRGVRIHPYFNDRVLCDSPREQAFLMKGVILGAVPHRRQMITMDASINGRGEVVQQRHRRDHNVKWGMH